MSFDLLSLSKGRLYRRQIGRIWRQVHNLSPTTDHRFGNPTDFMSTQVIHHHHVARPQRRPQHLLDVSKKHVARRRSWNRHQGIEATVRKRPDQGHVHPRVLGHMVDDALTFGGAPMRSCHRQIDARLIDERQAFGRNLGDLGAVVLAGLADPFGVTFARLEALFFRVSPRRLRARHSVAKPSVTPSSWRALARNSAKVRSGCWCIHMPGCVGRQWRQGAASGRRHGLWRRRCRSFDSVAGAFQRRKH